VSDTPRTDAEEFFPCESNYKVCEAVFARQLERELNTANDMFKKLNLHALNLTDRIKRLEQAGDAILNANNDDEEYEAIKHWNKAKEAKP
jgi:hypothetical protein